MLRGRVVSDEAQAWSNGTVRSSDYFARARRRAWSMASQAVRTRLRRGSPAADRGVPQSPPNGG
ncbi:MAG TPA: hypothetical protein VNK73_00060 [Actinomycetota bacterium]|jgi:hypothetical protein|nr:hypothetical protein [Actinomycetota bacterium]